MDFRIDAVLPATAAQLWAIFFDVQRVATLIPGCENVVEVEPLKEFSAVMKQKIGPFKLEVPTRIVVESHEVEQQVVLVAAGADRFTGTTIDVRLKVDLEELRGASGAQCRLGVDASMQVAGRLASLGYPIVKKRSEELFAEFERRLRSELSGVGGAQTQPRADVVAPATVPQPAPALAPAAAPVTAQARSPSLPVTASRPGRIELVLVWPRVGISVLTGIAVAHGAVAFGQSPWWWLVAPLLGVAAGLDRRRD
ncbi:CoxG family protein [Ramlibacter sp.]|uniref:CoxG family protein n=1 Tax=Ramlibacter sp. TaxID=1917967 RepID=UPI003D11706E